MRIFLVLAVVVFAAIPSFGADMDATLTKATIRFQTHDDNKDHDTALSVSVKNKVSIFLSQDIAEGQGLGGNVQFKDPSVHSFDLVVKSDKLKLKDLTVPVVNIHIQPNGNDRWIFDFEVTLTFSDGSSFSSRKTGVILDQNNKDFSGVFEN